MIDFLSPLWLMAAGAAAVPLLLHLLRRRIGARVEFPAVRYLARAEREHSRKLRLRNLLLMLLRIAA
ncbi:MAG TPA: BatA domain-containing protein, partial [Gemmatimonadaceae bacterium]